MMAEASDEFPIVVVDVPLEERQYEQLGSKAKFWFSDPARRFCLFKRGRENEDWSEKVGAELAGLLGLPHASVELAVCDDAPGIVSPSFLARHDQLIHGNEILLELDAGYPNAERYHVKQHTVDAALSALDRLQVRAWEEIEPALPETFCGQDLLVGYLLLDAWIGNADRHHENWAVVQRGGLRFLAPTYDHASSLGRNETGGKMARLLHAADPRSTTATYAARCRSAFFEAASSPRPMHPADAYALAARERPRAGAYWRERLAAVAEARVEQILQRVPHARIGPLHREFACELLRINRERIMELAGIGNG